MSAGCTLCINIKGTNRIECFSFPRKLPDGRIVYMCTPSPFAPISFREMSEGEFEEFKRWYETETNKV